MKFIFLLLFFPIYAFASIEVAFLEVRNYGGQLLQLEQNGKFAHIAISYQGNWLHAHPVRGVELISLDELKRMGAVESIITVSEHSSLEAKVVERYLGKPFDAMFSWQDDKIYCSELVAKLLGIEPQPMSFESKLWSADFQSRRNDLGISPDDIFRVLKQKGYKEQTAPRPCSEMLQSRIS